MTYKAVGRSIINYAAPVWSTNLRGINYRNIQYTQNEALRIATGCHKMSSVNHLHVEAEMLKLLSAQYLARCLEPGNVVVVVDLPLLRVAVEGSDNPVSLEKPCQASLPPDQQGRHSLGRQPEVQYVA